MEYMKLWAVVDQLMCAHFKQWAYTLSNDGRSVFVKRCHVGRVKQLLKSQQIAGVTVNSVERF